MEEVFAELSHDPSIVNKLQQFNQALDDIEATLNIATDPSLHDKLTNMEKIKLNSLLSFSLNTLFWMHLRAEGINAQTHEINNENDRLKRIMIRAQEISLSRMPAPRLDTDVAKRFIRSSLWTPNKNNIEQNNVDESFNNNDENGDADDFDVVVPNSDNT